MGGLSAVGNLGVITLPVYFKKESPVYFVLIFYSVVGNMHH
jgi:hypothetical protein